MDSKDFTNYKYDFRRSQERRIIAISSQKGGVGKSTTAINLSAYLGDFGYNTILVDLDPQGNSTNGLGIDEYDFEASTYDLLISNGRPDKAIIKTKFKNLMLIPSNSKLLSAETELAFLNGNTSRLKDSLKLIQSNYDFIIIDCSPSLGILTINALTSAKEIVIPVQCEYYAMNGITKLIEIINMTRNKFNNELEEPAVLFTMHSKTLLSNQVLQHLKDNYSGKIFNTIIPRNIMLAEAPSSKVPISIYNPDCRGALAYKSFAEEIINNDKDGTKPNSAFIKDRFWDFWKIGPPPRHAVKKKNREYSF